MHQGEFEIVRKLVRFAGDAETLGMVDGFQNSALHYAAFFNRLEIAKFLLKGGAAVSAPNHVGNRPLHLAVEAGHPDLVRLLLQSGAETQAVDLVAGNTALHLAYHKGAQQIVQLLLAQPNAPTDVKNVQGRTPQECRPEA